ncbi:GxxExxY protein, partial [bacterium]|nr:GxxExxY protein [bacterium]
SDITQKIIGSAMEVHRLLGTSFQEVIYQRALEIEMSTEGLAFAREYEMDIFYKEHRIGGRRVDFFVENCVMVELKALVALEDVHLAQAKNYLEAYNLEIGLLINFGAKSLQFKRIHNNSINLINPKNQENQGSDNE